MRSEAGTLLLESGIIDESQLQKALSASVASGRTFVQTLIYLGYVNDKELASFFASRLHIPLAEKSLFLRLPEFITRLIPLDIVLTHRTIPVMLHQGVLHMAMSDPTNREAIEEISFITGYSASPVAAPEGLLEQAMEEYYGIPPDNTLEEIQQISKNAQPTLPSEIPILSQIAKTKNNSASHFETLPRPFEPASTPKENDTGPVTGLPTQQPNNIDQPMVIEPASGELAELFGMASKDDEIIHLTKAKNPSVTSINAAIVKKVQSVLRQNIEKESSASAIPSNQSIPSNSKIEKAGTPNPPDADEPANIEFPPIKDAAEAKYLVENASERDEIASTLIQFSRTFMERVVIFIIKKDMLVGWMGTGPGIRKNQIKGIILPLSSPSVFRTTKETQTDYFGSMPRTSTNDMFLAALGEVRPRQVLLIPITVRQKAICILYGDCGGQPGFRKDLGSVHLLALDASLAFERIIIEKKINRLVKK